MVISENEKLYVFKKNSAENYLQTNVLLSSSIHYVHILSEKGSRVKTLPRLLKVARFFYGVYTFVCTKFVSLLKKSYLCLKLKTRTWKH